MKLLQDLPLISNDDGSLKISDLENLSHQVDSEIANLDQIISSLSSTCADLAPKQEDIPERKRQEMENQSTSSLSIVAPPPLIKKLKLTIRSPSSDSSTSTTNVTSPTAQTTRPAFGYKNLVRVKELSRRMSIDLDSNKKKSTEQQIPISTFWSFIEPFFGPLNEEDFAFLRGNVKLDESLFIVPPVNNAPLTQNVKNLSFRIVALLLAEGGRAAVNLESNSSTSLEAPLNGGLESEDEEAKEQASQLENSYYQTEFIPDIQHRILKELSIIGLPMLKSTISVEPENPVDSSFRELKCLQYCLKAVHEVNSRRKKILCEFLESKMASQEYYSIMDELDKQIEIAYTKKYKVAKKKKKNSHVDIEVECPEVVSLLAKRANLVEKYPNIVLPRSQLSKELSVSLIDAKAEEEIGKKWEIPTLSDAEARKAFRIHDIVAKSQVKVWPKDK